MKGDGKNMIDDQPNLNVGEPGTGGDTPDQGGVPLNPAAAGTPEGVDGQQPAQGADELTKYKAEVRRLNRALASATKGLSVKPPSPTPQGANGESPFETPQGQYAISLKLATANLASKLESLYSLYPEVPAEEINRIRKNPWAYVQNQDLFFNGDWEGAAEDIEYLLLDRTEALKGGQPPIQGKGGSLPVRPVVVNTNPSAEPPPSNATPGTAEDANPWTMPMNKLEQEKNKEIQRIKSKK